MTTPTTRGAPDVIVIGGGIVGVAAAAHLAERGRRVMLVERHALASGASGRNSGVVQHPFDPVLIDLHLETVTHYRALADRTDDPFHLPPEPAGLMSVSHDEDLVRREAAELAIAHPGLRPVFLPPSEARELEPSLAPDVAACRLAIGYPIGPVAATRAYARWARELGVDIRLETAARPWIVDGRVAGVRIGDDGRGGQVPAADVVVAAGPWTPDLIDASGAWRPIRPLWGVVVTVDIADPPRHVLEEAEIDIEPADGSVETRQDDGPPQHPGEPGPAFSLVTADGASSLGSTFLDDEPSADEWIPALVAHGARFVPAVATARLGAVRSCARPLSRDGRPLIGRVPWVDGLWVAAGHGPWGISTGPASGRLLADLVTGVRASPPDALDPARFGEAAP